MNKFMMTMHIASSKSLGARKLITLAAASLLLAACASAPQAPEGSAEVRSKLTSLRTNSELASRAPIEIQAAEVAVKAAERPQESNTQARHLVLIADQKVEIAHAWAQSRLLEDQREDLSSRTEAMRLDARTREADRARNDATNSRNQAQAARSDANAARNATDVARDQAAMARNDANASRRAADTAQGQTAVARDQAATARNDASAARSATSVAQNQADRARQDTDAARAENEELQRQINDLNAQMTDRGLVVTLGDVLFETDKSDLRSGSLEHLDKLAAFLNRYEDRTVSIEGHTDSTGDESYNLNLSERRAESVRSYLTNHGVDRSRLEASGKGEGSPITGNNTAIDRQQNRRVEVIIATPAR
ncbi:MAG: OmpA family protein [Gammaproteobacteria bacterium]|nr:OmpA family protein [Gammaproteobacteria bacterium]